MSGPCPSVIRLSLRQKEYLTAIQQKHKAPSDLIMRARFILLAEQGYNNTVLCQKLGMCRKTVRKW